MGLKLQIILQFTDFPANILSFLSGCEVMEEETTYINDISLSLNRHLKQDWYVIYKP